MEHVCPNCRSYLKTGQSFCSDCGQKTGIPRITTKTLLRDFLQTVLHAEKGIGNFIRGLAIHPGNVVSEYVEGKRKKYFNPFSFLAISIAFMLLVNSWWKPYNDLPEPKMGIMARMPDEKTRELYKVTVERDVRIQRFFNKNMNFGTLITAPFFAAFLWLFFRHSKRNYAEIAVAWIILTAFIDFLFTLFWSPILAMLKSQQTSVLLFFTGMILETFYYAWGLKGFFGYRTARGYFKVLLAIWLAGLIGLGLVLVCYYFYVYHGAAEIVQYLY